MENKKGLGSSVSAHRMNLISSVNSLASMQQKLVYRKTRIENTGNFAHNPSDPIQIKPVSLDDLEEVAAEIESLGAIIEALAEAADLMEQHIFRYSARKPM